MDVKVIIRDLMARGMTLDEIKRNLEELGVENVEALVDGVNDLPDSSKQTSNDIKPAESEPQKEKTLLQKSKSLFQEKNLDKKELLQLKKKETPAEEVPLNPPSLEQEDEEPELQITSISNEGEKEITIGSQKRLKKTGSEQEKIFTKMPKTSSTTPDELEEKLDEIIALLKSLQEINKKVLETDRNVLLRLKN